MKKQILKTTVISVLLIVVATSLIYLALCAFAPNRISDFYYNVKNYELSEKYAVKAYNKNSTIENLCVVTESAILSDNHQNVCYYAELLLNDDGYETAIENKHSYYDNYIRMEYVKALYDVGSYVKSVDSAVFYIISFDSTPNTVTSLTVKATQNNDRQTLTLLVEKLSALEQTEGIANHLNAINEYLLGE